MFSHVFKPLLLTDPQWFYRKINWLRNYYWVTYQHLSEVMTKKKYQLWLYHIYMSYIMYICCQSVQQSNYYYSQHIQKELPCRNICLKLKEICSYLQILSNGALRAPAAPYTAIYQYFNKIASWNFCVKFVYKIPHRPIGLGLRPPRGVHQAHLHQAYKPCFVRAVPPQTYGNVCWRSLYAHTGYRWASPSS